MQAGLFSNHIEFDGIKTLVVQTLPNAQEFDSIPIPQPVLDDVIRPLAVLVAGDMRERNVVRLVLLDNIYQTAFDGEDGLAGFARSGLLTV